TADEIEKLARDRKPLPEHTTLPESCLYETLAWLWDAYRAQRVDREQAHASKMRILRQFAEFSAAYDKYCETFREQQDNIRRIGTLRTAIVRETDERERLRLCIQAIAAMTGDRVFEKTELRRLEEI
ncbi:MAG: hypothetical protein IJ906_01915, partial [Oscillospiraceae bacterium]|nr:hypothetical protein [Oscillospiraceae bacterium]